MLSSLLRPPMTRLEFADVYDPPSSGIPQYLTRRLGADIAEDLTADAFVFASEARARLNVPGQNSSTARRHRQEQGRQRWTRAGLGRACAYHNEADPVTDSCVGRAPTDWLPKHFKAGAGTRRSVN